MHVSLSLYLAKTTHLHFKMFEDVIVGYQLYNPESFKESKIKYFQLEILFFSPPDNKVHRTNNTNIIDLYMRIYIYIYTSKKLKPKSIQ